MKSIYFILFSIFIVNSSCSSEKDKLMHQIDLEINNLKTIEQRNNFLTRIFKDDQDLRLENQDPKFENLPVSQNNEAEGKFSQDQLNLIKIEKYLMQFGHPDKANFSGEALNAPWIVIHHAKGLEVRKKHFKTIYNAYLRGDIVDNAISTYLTSV